jgi:uncharacterized protein
MFGYDALTITVITLSMVLGGVVKGITGIGLPIVAMAFILNFVDPKVTLAILVLPILVTNLWQAARTGNIMQPLKRFWLMTVTFLVCLFIGARLVVKLDADMLFAVLGVCVVAFSASNLIRPPVHPLRPTTERWVGPIAGGLGGILGGISTIWGPPMMMYLMMLKLDKETWIRTVGLIWFAGAIPLTIAYWQNGVLNSDTAPLSAYACIPGMVGIRIGEIIRDRIRQETFRKVMLAALVIIGLNLIRRALFS